MADVSPVKIASVPNAWGKPNPWVKQQPQPQASSSAAPIRSLADIQREQQALADAKLALKLQAEQEAAFLATVHGVHSDVVADDDEAAAAAAALAAADAADAAAAAAVVDAAEGRQANGGSAEDDLALAMALQAAYNDEYTSSLQAAERRANRFTGSKVKVSMDLYRFSVGEKTDYAPAVEAEAGDSQEEEDSSDQPTVFDRKTRTFRAVGTGEVITKHDSDVCGRRNRRKVDDFAMSFNSGNMAGKDDIRLPNKVYNTLRRFSVRTARLQQRIHENKERSTHALALDAPSRLILFRLVNAGILHQVNGCLSSGKESVVFHGLRHEVPEDLSSPMLECAIKVFKTTLTEFKQRQQFLHGDRRFEARVGKQSARKLVKVWAEKEMSNLLRMSSHGMACPAPVVQRKHVLVMNFLGENGTPAPKLREVELSPAALEKCYNDCVKEMTKLYKDCDLIHGDLSEYNILWHREEPFFIDVGQSVEPSHPRAKQYLYRDCVHLTRYFEKAGLSNTLPPAELLKVVSGDLEVTPEEETDFMVKINASKGPVKTFEREQDAEDHQSEVCLKFMEPLSAKNKDLLLQGIAAERVAVAAEQDDDDDDEDDDDDDDEVDDELDQEGKEDNEEEENEEEQEGDDDDDEDDDELVGEYEMVDNDDGEEEELGQGGKINCRGALEGGYCIDERDD